VYAGTAAAAAAAGKGKRRGADCAAARRMNATSMNMPYVFS
jgi:hypothetical protein